MIKTKVIFSCALIAGSVGTLSAAELINCRAKSPVLWTDCSVNDLDLNSLADQKINFEVGYTVSYSFICTGHELSISLYAGKSYIPILSGSTDAKVIVTGSDNLKIFDPDRMSGRDIRKTFRPGCSLEVSDIEVLPSIATVGAWYRDAKDMSENLDLLTTVVELAADLDSVLSWEDSSSETLLTSVERKIEAFDGQCEEDDRTACRAKAHFTAVKNSLVAQIEGRPAPTIGDGDIAAVKDQYKKELDAEVKIGRDMIERFRKWELEIDEDLESVLEGLPASD